MFSLYLNLVSYQYECLFLNFPKRVIKVRNGVCAMKFICMAWAKFCGIDAINCVNFLLRMLEEFLIHTGSVCCAAVYATFNEPCLLVLNCLFGGRPSLYGVHGGVVVKALRYKPAGRRFDSRWCQDFSPWHNPSGRTMALGSTQPLTEMSTRCVSCHQECSWG